MCASSCQGRFVIAKIEGNKIIMNDPAHEINYEDTLSSPLKNFMFNPSFMGKLLKSLPDEKVFFSHSQNKYFVTGEGGYVSLIMEMKIVNQ